MTPELARIVFFAIAAVMWVVWLVGTRFALSRARPSRSPPGGPQDAGLSAGGLETRDVVTGEAVTRGDAEAVSKKLAEQLASASGAPGGGGVRITERTRERIVFERVPGSACGPALQAVDSGVVLLDAEGERVRVRYALSMKRFSRIMSIVAYVVCFGYCGLVVALVPLLVWTFVLPSEKEAVRWQVFQTFQMAHGVWPPFLVGALSRRLRGAAAGFVETLVANVAHIA